MNNKNLLIVDDDPLNCSTLADIFLFNGYHVDTAHSGASALKLIKKNGYSCVLSDIRMPRMNGVELLRRVKATHPKLVFILMTAYSDEALMLQGIREGALVTLAKPLDIERLLLHIQQICSRC